MRVVKLKSGIDKDMCDKCKKRASCKLYMQNLKDAMITLACSEYKEATYDKAD